MVTTSFPFFAFYGIKMSTVSCKWPTIMERPNYWYVRLLQEVEQQWVVDVVVVDIMQVHDVRLYLSHLFNKTRCGASRCQSMIVEQTALQRMGISVPFPAYTYQLRLRWPV